MTSQLPTELADLLAANPGKRLCSECVESMELGLSEPFEVSLAHETCVYCHGGTCDSHGRGYCEGWAHDACHNLPDYTRADDGRY